MFSQYNEEEIILDYFKDRKGSFLDIGAWDGVELSNTRALALRGWRGLLVEPDPEAFLKLVQNTRNIHGMELVNGAVSFRREVCKFYAQDEWGGTLNLSHAADGVRKLKFDYYLLTIKPDDLAYIGVREAMDFDFVSLDAEWVDLYILSTSKLMLAKTELLCIEINDSQFNREDPGPTMCRQLGFTKEIGRTPCNLIVSR